MCTLTSLLFFSVVFKFRFRFRLRCQLRNKVSMAKELGNLRVARNLQVIPCTLIRMITGLRILKDQEADLSKRLSIRPEEIFVRTCGALEANSWQDQWRSCESVLTASWYRFISRRRLPQSDCPIAPSGPDSLLFCQARLNPVVSRQRGGWLPAALTPPSSPLAPSIIHFPKKSNSALPLNRSVDGGAVLVYGFCSDAEALVNGQGIRSFGSCANNDNAYARCWPITD